MVVPEDTLSVPQAPAGLALVVKVMVSPATGVPLLSVTVADTVDALAPSALTLDGVAVTATVFLIAVWVIVVDALLPPLASVAVMAQLPTVLEAV